MTNILIYIYLKIYLALYGLESLLKTSKKLIYFSAKEDRNELIDYFFNFLDIFLMENNPKHGKTKEFMKNF